MYTTVLGKYSHRRSAGTRWPCEFSRYLGSSHWLCATPHTKATNKQRSDSDRHEYDRQGEAAKVHVGGTACSQEALPTEHQFKRH
jgi:hypothetical protein